MAFESEVPLAPFLGLCCAVPRLFLTFLAPFLRRSSSALSDLSLCDGFVGAVPRVLCHCVHCSVFPVSPWPEKMCTTVFTLHTHSAVCALRVQDQKLFTGALCLGVPVVAPYPNDSCALPALFRRRSERRSWVWGSRRIPQGAPTIRKPRIENSKWSPETSGGKGRAVGRGDGRAHPVHAAGGPASALCTDGPWS